MSKRIFIIVDAKDAARIKLSQEVEQILKEYDFDVVNPTLIEDWERNKLLIKVMEDKYAWVRRDVKKLVDCDGAVAMGDFTENAYERGFYQVAETLPWIDGKIKFLAEWIGEKE